MKKGADLKSEKNIVKETAKELGLTYKELAEAIGYGESAVKMAISSNKISKPMKKAIELYLENIKLRNDLQDFNTLTSILKKHI